VVDASVVFGSVELPGLPGPALTVAPAVGRRGSVLVVPGVHGQTSHILEVAQRLASHGVRAVVADWFCTAAQRGEVRTPADITPAVIALEDEVIADELARAAEHLRRDGSVGLLGYCVGATFSLLAAARTDALAGVVAYYGVLRYRGDLEGKAADPVDTAGDVRPPVLAHYGMADGWCPPHDVDALEAALAANGRAHEIYRYPGAGHAFEEAGRPGFRPVAAAEAARRTLVFLDHRLSA
jgi:carboxymethylenebutenolidase